MLRNGDNGRATPAFTLVELILVMALVITLLALVAPSLSGSFRHHNLEEEAARLFALTEYGREEAISQGVPMVVWVSPDTGHFGLQEQSGYTGNPAHHKDYCLNPDIHFELTQAPPAQQGVVNAILWTPDGVPDPAGVPSIRLVDRFGSSMTVAQTADACGYEIVKEAQ